MRLLCIQKNTKVYLLLELLSTPQMLYALDSKHLNDVEKIIIRKLAGIIDAAESIQAKREILKIYCPSGLSQAYRTFVPSTFELVQEVPLPPL